MTTAVDTAPAKPINISGGNYPSFDCGDGYILVRNVPLFGEVSKGVKGAPKDIGRAEHEQMVAIAERRYTEGKFAAPAHKGHNKPLELADPEFLGFSIPRQVVSMVVDGQQQSVVIGDVKLKAAAFDRAVKGELPFISPEVDWERMEITSVSFLDSKPPFFKFPIFTVSPPVADPAAKFDAVLRPASFADQGGGEQKKSRPEEPELRKHEMDDNAAQRAVQARFADYDAMLRDLCRMNGIAFRGQNMSNDKGTSAPVDQKVTAPAAAPVVPVGRMSDDPAEAAKFAAQEDRIAKLEKREADRDAAEKAKLLGDKALEDLRGYQVGDKAKSEVYRFAAKGEDELKAFVEAIKGCAPKQGAGTFAEAETQQAEALKAPSVAKFVQQGPEHAAAAAGFAAEYRKLAQLGQAKFMTMDEAQYVEFRMKGAGK